jgi:hypothetical protein
MSPAMCGASEEPIQRVFDAYCHIIISNYMVRTPEPTRRSEGTFDLHVAADLEGRVGILKLPELTKLFIPPSLKVLRDDSLERPRKVREIKLETISRSGQIPFKYSSSNFHDRRIKADLQACRSESGLVLQESFSIDLAFVCPTMANRA